MNIEPTEPYIYQPFGMQNKAHWASKKIYGIGGTGLTLVHGVTREQAEKILAIITGKDKDYLTALAEKDSTISYLEAWKKEAETSLIQCGQALAEKDERFIEERKHAEWLQRQIDEDVTIICTRNAEIAKKDKEIVLWKKSFRAADKDNAELREENAALIADMEELKRFVRDITLELQEHRSKTPAQMDALFKKAYTLYAKYDVENRKAIKTVEK